MLIEDLGLFIKQIGESTYKTLTKSNDDDSVQMDGIVPDEGIEGIDESVIRHLKESAYNIEEDV